MDHEDERRVILSNGDRVSGVVLLVLGAFMAYGAMKLTYGSMLRPGPGFFPLWLAVLLIGLSVAILTESFRRERSRHAVRFAAGGRDVAVTGIALLAYAMALEWAGYLLATLVVMALLFRRVAQLRWLVALGVALAGTVASYLLFRELGVPLPSGVLPF